MAYYDKNYYKNKSNNRGDNELRNKKYEPLDKLKYVDNAEKIILKIKEKRGNEIINTNQIRIILDLINEVYIPVKSSTDKELNEDILSKLQYIKMKIAYQAGREKKVKIFVDNTDIMKHIDHVKTKDDLILLAHYMEALVAYHKYHIDKV